MPYNHFFVTLAALGWLTIWKHVCIRYRLSQSGLNFFFFPCVDCAPCIGQRKHNEFIACALLVPNVIDWRWSDVLLTSTFTRGKTLTFLNMQKMCAEVLAHNKWITFIRRSRQIINGFWRTPSESQRTDQNSSFFYALDVCDCMWDWGLKPLHQGYCPWLNKWINASMNEWINVWMNE